MVDVLVLLICAVALVAIGVRIWRFERREAKRDTSPPGRHPRWLRILAAYTIGGVHGDGVPPGQRDVGPTLWRRRSRGDDLPAKQDEEHPSRREDA